MDYILKLKPQLSLFPKNYKDYLINLLESLTTELQNPEFRKNVPIELFTQLTLILECFYMDFDISTWILRVFRNAVANSSRNQKIFFQSTGLDVVIDKFVESQVIPGSIQALALQVIGNSIVQNSENSKILMSNTTQLTSIVNLLQHKEDKVADYAAMVGMNLTHCQPHLMLQYILSLHIEYLVDQVNLEFVVLWLESLIGISGFVRKVYNQFDSDYKVKFLHVLSGNFDNSKKFPQDSLEFIIYNFKNLGDQILTTNPNGLPDEFNVLEITTTVEFFCKIIQFPELLNTMKMNRSFVASIIVLLRGVHEIGTTGENCFTPIEKLETLNTTRSNDEVGAEPGFLFKANLIRLVGSLVDGDKENQDQVRELGALPIILNCTKVDGRNPFIPQCSIVTLKFLLDDNIKNQDYIKTLQKQQ